MDERTLGGVAGNDVDAIVAAFESGGAVIEAEMAFGSFRSVATPARGFEDGLDVAVKIDFCVGRWGEFGFVENGSGADERESVKRKRCPDVFLKDRIHCLFLRFTFYVYALIQHPRVHV